MLYQWLLHRLTDEGVYPAVVQSIAECLLVCRKELCQQLIHMLTLLILAGDDTVCTIRVYCICVVSLGNGKAEIYTF